jgi:hypothetical protein
MSKKIHGFHCRRIDEVRIERDVFYKSITFYRIAYGLDE